MKDLTPHTKMTANIVYGMKQIRKFHNKKQKNWWKRTSIYTNIWRNMELHWSRSQCDQNTDNMHFVFLLWCKNTRKCVIQLELN